MTLINELLQIALTAAPWLLLGLMIAGLIKAWLPETLLQRWMGGRGLGSIVRA
ncbi:MAG: permease, partial [Pseudomonadota bacterium]|nr:permease [Pseudomonadota bacterium]